ncbi:MAG: transglutaminase domain-containing protein [Planctomycetota bacterium]|nr:MAG: transglutaminase domain-containing protein [Planctomycetota bacterium]
MLQFLRFAAGACCAVLLFAWGCAAPPRASAGAGAPPAQALEDVWLVTSMNGARVGYVHSVSRPETMDGAAGTLNESDARIKMGRLGSEVEIVVHTRTFEDSSGKLRRIEMDTQFSNQPGRFEGVVDGDVLRARSEALGEVREFEIPWDEEIISDRGLELLYARAASEPEGTELAGLTFDPTSMQTITYVLETGARETIEWRGEPVEATAVHFEMDLLPGMRGTAWIDDQGRALRTVQPVMAGVEMVFELSTKEEALAAGAAENRVPDLFSQLMIRSDVRIPHPRRVDEALFRVRLKDGVAEFPDFSFDRRQTVEQDGASERLLRVRRLDGTPGHVTRPVTGAPPDVAAALESSSSVQCDDPELVAAAQAAVAGESDAWRAAQTLERWVYERIDKKSMGVAFASALEVFREGRGDCSEHALLLAAMCRAAGIPARVVMGWEYAAGIFGGHAWTEVWCGDWYALDATNAAGGADATHIALGNSVMADGGTYEMFGNLARGIAAVDIQVVELRYGDRLVGADQLSTGHLVQGDVYRNELLGLAFAKPADWEFDSLHPEGFTGDIVEIEPPQGSDQIEVGAMEVPYFFDFDELRQQVGERLTGPVETRLDGRTAHLYVRTEGDTENRALFVLEDDTLFTFELRASSDDTRRLFHDFLATVDFDL